MTDPRYPIGSVQIEQHLSAPRRSDLIAQIAALPSELKRAVAGLSGPQLDAAYRPGGWTVRQLVHHIADSHLNAYLRCKLALTEDREPVVHTYHQDRWATLPDGHSAPAEISLALLAALHERWVLLLRALPPGSFARTVHHPESGVLSLDALVSYYAWHGRHHVAHIVVLRAGSSWAYPAGLGVL